MQIVLPQKRLIVNSLANLVGRFWTKALALLIVPFLYHHLGEDRWAVYGVGLSAAMLASLADPALTCGYTKVFSEYIAKGRAADLKRLAAAGFLLYGAWSALFLLAAWLLMPHILTAAGVPGPLRAEAGFFFLSLFVWRSVIETFNVFYHLLMASQRMTTASLLTMAGAVIHYAAIGAVIASGGGLKALGWVFMASGLAQSLLLAPSAPGVLRAMPAYVNATPLWPQIRYLFAFAWRMKLAANCETVVLQSDKIFISRLVDLTSGGLYQLGTTLTIVLREFLRVSIGALLPVATTLAARDNPALLRAAHRASALLYARIAAPVFLVLVPAAPFLLKVWVGGAPSEAIAALAMTALAFHAGTAFSVSMEFGAACHLPQIQMRAALLSALLSLALFPALIYCFGCYGAGLASFVSLLAGGLCYARGITRELNEKFAPFVRDVYLAPLLSAGIPAALLALLTWPVRREEWFATSGRLTALGYLVWTLAAYALAYGFLLTLQRRIKPGKPEPPQTAW